ncbi:MAG: winged helix DNA-binding domain-containing protein, partial [bacterium]|nr:winged helix DNA-binding domain-containing protein [bacterium]
MMKLEPDSARSMSVGVHGLGDDDLAPLQVASRVVGLHNTTQHTPHLSVRARVSGFERSHLENLMWGEWKMVRYRAMRLTMFVFPLDLLEVAAAATRHLSAGLIKRWFQDAQITEKEFERLASQVEEPLAANRTAVRGVRKGRDSGPPPGLPGLGGRLCDVGRRVGG